MLSSFPKMTQTDAEYRGTLINAFACFTLIVMILFVFGKVATKWKMIRKFQNDDILMILAMFTAVGHCVAVAAEVQSGLGQPENALDSHQLDLDEKSAYVSQFFYVFTLYITKTAALQFLMLLARPNAPDRPNLRRTIVKGTTVFILTWLVIAVLCISFQCAVPNPWDQGSGRCFNQLVFWIANGAIDVTTQLLIGLAPLYLLFKLQIPTAKKYLVFLSFTPNLTTIPLAVLRLVYLYKVYHSSDTTFDAVNVALITLTHTNYCIVASCVPFLKPLVGSLAIGLMTNDIHGPVRWKNSTSDKSKVNPFAILSGEERFQTEMVHGWARSPAPSDYTFTVTEGRDNNMKLQGLERYDSQDRMTIK